MFTRRLQQSATVANPNTLVDNSTLQQKFMMGYQGWHQTPTDGSTGATWRHWFSGTPPTGPLVDFWPDVSELTPAEQSDTGLKLPDGSPAYLFSDYNALTVLRHFEWMRDNALDGVMLQRFCSELSINYMFAERNQVTQNVMAGAEATGRVFNIMYDISNQAESTLVSTIINDWKYMVDTLQVTQSTRYLREAGLPIVSIWGFGFSDRPGTTTDLASVLDFFHNDPNPDYHATVIGGVNNDWRTNATWATALQSFDIISPWTVGRYTTPSSATSFINSHVPADLAYASQNGQLYMPVIWPGYSFYNQNNANALNQIPRLGGNFMWQQAYNNLAAGVPALYGAMFDEVNEGTALFKMATTSASWPSGLQMVPLDTDGYSQLPSDWYLQVSNEVTKMVHGTIPLSATMPITPS